MVSGNAQVDVKAARADVLAAIADIENFPSWSPIHKEVKVLETDDQGRPAKAWMKVSLMGISDEQTLSFEWSDSGVTWDLVEGGQQKAQHAEYTLTDADGGGTHVEFEMTLDPKIPVPGFVLNKGKKAIIEMATEGLRDQVDG